MITFLPLRDFDRSAQVLDMERLGRQRIDGLQALEALTINKKSKWRNHLSTIMWKGYEPALVQYILAMCKEWERRKRPDSVAAMAIEMARKSGIDKVQIENAEMPPWLGRRTFHESHRAYLIRKMPARYGKLWPGHVNVDKLYWPVRRGTV